MIQPIVFCTALIFALACAFTAHAQDATDLTGVYGVEGSSGYSGQATIAKRGERYEIVWVIGEEQYRGVGLLEGNVLSVAYQGAAFAGVVAYRIEPGGRLAGRWTTFDGGEIETETLIKGAKPRPQNKTPKRRS